LVLTRARTQGRIPAHIQVQIPILCRTQAHIQTFRRENHLTLVQTDKVRWTNPDLAYAASVRKDSARNRMAMSRVLADYPRDRKALPRHDKGIPIRRKAVSIRLNPKFAQRADDRRCRPDRLSPFDSGGIRSQDTLDHRERTKSVPARTGRPVYHYPDHD
jgi:hypothetical protein